MTNPKLTTTSRKSQAGFGIRAKPGSVAGGVTPIGAPNQLQENDHETLDLCVVRRCRSCHRGLGHRASHIRRGYGRARRWRSHVSLQEHHPERVNSKDHTTLVAAVKAAGLVDTLSGPGPFTVFAPTNAAFGKLPPGTVDNLVKPENKATLTKVLTYHVVPGRMSSADLMKTAAMGAGK